MRELLLGFLLGALAMLGWFFYTLATLDDQDQD